MARSQHILLFFSFFSLVEVLVLYQLMTYELKLQEAQISVGYYPEESDVFNSTCSRAADRRGPHQKVISYSIYGDFSQPDIVRKYLKPFRETIKTIPVIYPGKPKRKEYIYILYGKRALRVL